MQTPSAAEVLIGLLPVMVGGFLTILGIVLGPPLSHFLTRDAERKSARLRRYEEILASFYEFPAWMDLARDIRAFGSDRTLGPSPLLKARAAAVLYFPELLTHFEALDIAAKPYELWMFQAVQARLKGNIADINKGMMPVFNAYWASYLEVRKVLEGSVPLSNSKNTFDPLPFPQALLAQIPRS